MPKSKKITLPDAHSLPPHMTLLPNGEEMPTDEFFRLHSKDICAYPDAQLAVAIPAQNMSDDVKLLLKGSVGAASGLLISLLFPEAVAGKIAAGGVSAVVGGDGADWLARKLSTGAHVKIIKVRDFMECK